jgi:Lrp/AsnC family transcriptional regulator for asnA, asnC and gidA
MKPISLEDRKLMTMLRSSPDTPTKKMATALGVTEKTILNRIKSLTDSNDLKITAQWDMASLGLHVVGHAYIDIGKLAPEDAISKLAKIDEVCSIGEFASWPSLSPFIAAKSVKEFYSIIHNKIGMIKGIKIVETELASSVFKYRTDYFTGSDSREWRPALENLAPEIKIDQFDLQITDILQFDGSISNREIARRLNVSETTVRQRLKKLQDQNAFRKVVVINPLAFDYEAASSVRVTIEQGKADKFCHALSELEHAALVVQTLGVYNVHALLFGTSHSAIAAEAIAHIRAISPGSRYEITPLMQPHKHTYGLVALNPP